MESTRLPSRRAARLGAPAANEQVDAPAAPRPTAVVPPAAPAPVIPPPSEPGWLSVRTSEWLDPDRALAVVQSVAPAATLAMSTTEYQGPPADLRDAPPPGSVLDGAQRAALHAAADAFDRAALANPATLDGYGITVDLAEQGLIAVEVGADPSGEVAYRVRWFAPEGAATGTPARAISLVLRIATALSDVLNGPVT